MSQIVMRTNSKARHSNDGDKLPLLIQCSLKKGNKKILEENNLRLWGLKNVKTQQQFVEMDQQ